MDSESVDIRRELDEIRFRLTVLEKRLDIVPPMPLPARPEKPVPPPLPAATQPPLAPPTGPRPTIIQEAMALRKDRAANPRPDPSVVRAMPPPLPLPTEPTAIRRKPSGLSDMERLVGGRWYAVLGALAVIIGIGLFVKLAYDQGWLKVPPAYRCAGGAFFGIVLLIAAEFLRKKINAWAAFGGYAAGLGSIYVSVYAAFRLYELFDAAPCFILLALTAVVGVFIGVRARLAAVSITALVGGYLAPILLYDAPSVAWALPAYLLVLMAIGLTVSWRGGVGFNILRVLVWIATVLLGTVWARGEGANETWIQLGFLLAAWCGLQGELILTIRKGALTGAGFDRRAAEAIAMVGSMLVTAWLGWLAAWNARTTGMMADWMGPLMAAGGSAFGAMLVGESPALILDKPRTPAQRLGACMALQAGGMAMVALALALSGPAEAIAWLALALAAMLGGWRSDLLGIRLYALALLAFGTGRLIVFDSWHTSMGVATVDTMGLHLTSWAALMGAAGVLWLVVTRLGLPDKAPAALRVVVCALAACLLVGGLSHSQSDSRSMIFAWVGVLALLAASRAAFPRGWPDAVATALLIVPTAAWIVTECTKEWPTTVTALLYPGFLIGLMLMGAGIAASWWLRRGVPFAPVLAIGRLAAVLALVLAFTDTSLEAARVVQGFFEDQTAQRAAISLWWGVFAIGMLTVGFVKSRGWVRHVGLGLLGAAAIKVVAYDLAGVSQVWRIASFLGLGLLMLGVAVVYARAVKTEAVKG
ncbi:hypothetical protein PHYC_01241 [Phycisphaerales bacterium]|nr:hypothetical protein PHYC_01241 [Phycisphaerales bacterium]